MPPSSAPSWKQLAKKAGPGVKCGRPATEDRIARAEQALGVRFPAPLRELLLEADGIADEYGSQAVWPVAEIERQNKQFRTNEAFRDLYMPFDHLLLFGTDAGSDHFAFAIQADGNIHKNDVFRWQHENDARSWFAPRLEQFLEKRLKSEDE
jgi:cell wall assembly regulator SMI1